MPLRIHKLDTTCYVPSRYRNEAAVVGHFARGRFAADLASHLGPSLARQPAIVRIKQLRIRVILPASQLNEASLSRAWTQAFGRALFTASAYPTGTGPVEVFRADSVETFIAGAIRDLLDGRAIGSWQYAEFDELFCSGVNAAAIALLSNWPELTLAILFELERLGALEKMLPRFEDLALERIFAILASPRDTEPHSLGIDDLIRCGKLILQHPPQKLSALRSRAFALKLFLHAHATKNYISSSRTIFHLANALAILISNDLSLLSSILHNDPVSKQVPAPTASLLQAFALEVNHIGQSPQLDQLRQVLGDLRSALQLPPADAMSRESRVVSSDWCGLFFLVGILERLGWVRAWQRLPEFQVGGISPLLAGLALAIIGRFEYAPESLDPGIALLSGYLEDPDLKHVRSVFQEFPVEARVNVLRAALGKVGGAESWQTSFESLASVLLQRFTEAVPGFRRSSQAGIVHTFMQRRGRARIDEQRIVIEPEPSAFHVALDIAGLDAPVHAVSWLGGRRLEFAIEEP